MRHMYSEIRLGHYTWNSADLELTKSQTAQLTPAATIHWYLNKQQSLILSEPNPIHIMHIKMKSELILE